MIKRIETQTRRLKAVKIYFLGILVYSETITTKIV